MRDLTNDLEVRRASPWDKLRGLSAHATNTKEGEETDGRMPTDWFWPKDASQLPSEYRQALRQKIVRGGRS
jgi:hypothetical protein